jgi:hypothetical protein
MKVTELEGGEPKPILNLNLKRKWFDMILSGEKKEEYREIKPFWNRIFSSYIKIKGKYYHPIDVIICFSNGYAKDRDAFYCSVNGMKVGYGKEKWGAKKESSIM